MDTQTPDSYSSQISVMETSQDGDRDGETVSMDSESPLSTPQSDDTTTDEET